MDKFGFISCNFHHDENRKRDISISDVTISIFPINYGIYWFATVHVALPVLTPYINRMLEILNENDTKTFIYNFDRNNIGNNNK